MYYATDESEKPVWITSQSKVVFSGLGADEVWCGYSRYKTAAVRGGIPAMKEEMCLDLDRIWHRNMGRDDRVISVNGKEARFPFLDIEIQSWMKQNIPDTEETKGEELGESKCVLFDWSAQRGAGDKKLLRYIAKESFGLQWASSFEKRAIQFGSKIAKQTNVAKFGSNRKANGKA